MPVKTKRKKKKIKLHHIPKHIHHHIKKHLKKLKKKRPHLHKALVLMSFTLPIVLGAVLFGSSALYYYESYFDNTDYSKENVSVNLPKVKDDTLNWKVYKDDLSGFSIKYSDRWDDPEVSSAGGNGSKYLRKIVFDNGFDSSDKNYLGFEVNIYDSKKFYGPVNTDNLIAKNPSTSQINNCDKAEFQEASLGEGDYPAQEVDVSAEDKCFQEAYFFSLTRGAYTYNIVPKTGDNNNPINGGTKTAVIGSFPKFFELISTIVLSQGIDKAVDQASNSQNTASNIKKAPPHRILISLGRCAHKNDHPRKSRQHKGHHVDEDCCMDPDESPNPRCQY